MNDTCHGTQLIVPDSLNELCRAVADCPCVLPIGNATKQPLACDPSATMVSLRSLRGIIQYEPSEYTFTAFAGTTLAEINEVLRAKRQYLPFDPLLVRAGATIGGTIGAGLSGPGRFRYGGVRDFFLGVKALMGNGDIVRGGGNVVKNAAGFDLPKFFVGSLGRYAMMLEVTFKVFPQPPKHCTVQIHCISDRQAMERMTEIAASRWEADAIDYRPSQNTIYVRFQGPEDAVIGIAEDVCRTYKEAQLLEDAESDAFWRSITEMSWAESELPIIFKVPMTCERFLALQPALGSRSGISVHLSVAGGVCWIALDNDGHIGWLDQQFHSLRIPGLAVRGGSPVTRLGSWPESQMQQAIKQAMDPQGKYAKA